MKEQLRIAVEAGSPEAIIAAVKSGCDVNEHDEDSDTALTHTMWAGLSLEAELACIRCLVQLGARVSAEDTGGMGTSLHWAAGNGRIEALKVLLAADSRPALELFDDLDRTALICAVEGGHLDAAILLLEAGAQVDTNDVEKIGDTALAHAVTEQSLPMVELLLRHGADPTIPGWMQLTALHRARDLAEKGSTAQSQRIFDLLSGASTRVPRN